MHADQTHGINDLRSFYINSRKQINVFADYATSKYLTHPLVVLNEHQHRQSEVEFFQQVKFLFSIQ